MTKDEKIIQMRSALLTAQRVLRDYRKIEWESYTIPPSRSFDHMNKKERDSVRKLDRQLRQIGDAINASRRV